MSRPGNQDSIAHAASARAMRLVTWNCCRGPVDKKLPLLKPLNPTISVIQECPRPPDDDPSTLWFGDNPRQGIAVRVSDGYQITTVTPRDAPRYTIPIQISGPISFLLLAVWSQQDRPYRYVKAVIRAVDCYRDMIESQPTVIMGDFNSNTIWDHKRTKEWNHSGLVRKLADLGLISAYHQFFREAQGAETRPTLYMLRQKARPYHIDYCFMPQSWIPFLRSVDVGSYEDWKSASDHRPLVVDLAFPVSA